MIKKAFEWLKSLFVKPANTQEVDMSDIVQVQPADPAAPSSSVTADPAPTGEPTLAEVKAILDKLEHPVVEIWDEVISLAKKFV